MPVTNTVRAVLNTTTGRWFLWDRDGDRFDALPANGVALTATGAGTNAVHVYRIIEDRGKFQTMVATELLPATLNVYVKDLSSGNMVLKETASCTSFANEHCEFVLAGDYSTEATKYVRLDFRDGTAGSITASMSAVELWETRETAVTTRVGSWRILSALVAGIDDKRVRFESSNPSVCRIERGAIELTNYMQIAESPQQTDQYCALVGVSPGTATITCYAEADTSITPATVTVTVKTHPDDDPLPGLTGLAAELEAMLDNVRLPITLFAPEISGTSAYSWATEDQVLFLRTFVVPGLAGETFDLTLNFSGTIPRQCARKDHVNHSSAGFLLVLGLVNGSVLGNPYVSAWSDATPPVLEHEFLGAGLDLLLATIGCASAMTLNSPLAAIDGAATEDLDKTVSFTVEAGDTIVVGWVLAGRAPQGFPIEFSEPSAWTNLPTGLKHALMTVTGCTHHPANEAPA